MNGSESSGCVPGRISGIAGNLAATKAGVVGAFSSSPGQKQPRMLWLPTPSVSCHSRQCQTTSDFTLAVVGGPCKTEIYI